MAGCCSAAGNAEAVAAAAVPSLLGSGWVEGTKRSRWPNPRKLGRHAHRCARRSPPPGAAAVKSPGSFSRGTKEVGWGVVEVERQDPNSASVEEGVAASSVCCWYCLGSLLSCWEPPTRRCPAAPGQSFGSTPPSPPPSSRSRAVAGWQVLCFPCFGPGHRMGRAAARQLRRTPRPARPAPRPSPSPRNAPRKKKVAASEGSERL